MTDNQNIYPKDAVVFAAASKKFGIDQAQLVEAVVAESYDSHRIKALEENKEKTNLNSALSGMPLLIYYIAEQMAEAREAIDMMGGNPATVTSPRLPQDFKLPNNIVRVQPNLTGQTGIYVTCARYIGKKYVWGGKDLESAGVDCSGYVRGIFKKLGYELPFSSQDQANAIAKMAGENALKTSCRNIQGDQIPDNAVMTMGPKNGIGHVVIVTRNDKGERVVMQSMGGGVGVCEMPLEKFVNYLHRQPEGRTLTVANSGPLLQKAAPNISSTPKVNEAVAHIQSTAQQRARIDLAHTPMQTATAPAPIHHTPMPILTPGGMNA